MAINLSAELAPEAPAPELAPLLAPEEPAPAAEAVVEAEAGGIVTPMSIGSIAGIPNPPTPKATTPFTSRGIPANYATAQFTAPGIYA